MNKPVAWMVQYKGKHDFTFYKPVSHDDAVVIPLYTHPVKELTKAIEIIKDFQNDDVPPCKYYEDTYADGWMDACNEILWAIEAELEKAQEK